MAVLPATVKDEIDERKRLVQCPNCNWQGPFNIEHNFKMGLYILSCHNCNMEIFKFEDV